MRTLARRVGKLEAQNKPANGESVFRDPVTGELVSARDLASFLTMAELSIAEVCLAPEKSDPREFYDEVVYRRVIALEPDGRERIMTTLWRRSLDRRARRRDMPPHHPCVLLENDGFEWLLTPDSAAG